MGSFHPKSIHDGRIGDIAPFSSYGRRIFIYGKIYFIRINISVEV
jgi:hypothetical protein